MNMPERQGESCCDIVYDLIENELKISTQDIRFHAVHRVGKPAAQNVDNSTSTRPRPSFARFVSREHTEQVLGVENQLKKSDRYKDAYITKDYASAIQEERRSLIKAMFAAREKGRNAKVINRNLLLTTKLMTLILSLTNIDQLVEKYVRSKVCVFLSSAV